MIYNYLFNSKEKLEMKITQITQNFNQKSNCKNNNPSFKMTTNYAENLVTPEIEEDILVRLSEVISGFHPYSKQKLYLAEQSKSYLARFLKDEKAPNGKFLDFFNFTNSYSLDINLPDSIGRFRIKTTGGMTEKSKELWKNITDFLSSKVEREKAV